MSTPTTATKRSNPKASVNASSAADMAKAIAAIEKMTKQKPVNERNGTYPNVPTGNTVINMLIGGSPLADGKSFVCPGFPRERISEVYGPEASGKTTLALSAIVAVQKAGGKTMFLDFENALDHNYARSIGVDFDTSKLLYYTPTTLEEGLKMVYVAVKTGFDLVVIDSVAAMVPEGELTKGIDDPAKIGALAAAMSRNLPRLVQWLKGSNTAIVLLNQLRAIISKGGPGAETENTAGGKAVKFYASLRLKITRIRSDYVEKKHPITLKKVRQPIGNLVQAKIVKDKMDAKQGQVGEVFIRYGYGLDEFYSMIEAATVRNLIKKEGSNYVLGGEKFRGKDALRNHLIGNAKAFEDLREGVMDIMLAASPLAVEAMDEIDDDDIMSSFDQRTSDDEIVDGEDIPEAEISTILEGD